MGFACGLRADQHRRCAVHDARRVACVVHMVDAFDLWVALQGHRVKAHRTQLFKRGFEAAQCFHRGAGFDEFVLRQDDLAQLVSDRHD